MNLASFKKAADAVELDQAAEIVGMEKTTFLRRVRRDRKAPKPFVVASVRVWKKSELLRWRRERADVLCTLIQAMRY